MAGRQYAHFIFDRFLSALNSYPQATLLLISACWILIGAPLLIGAVQLMPFMRVACISWQISPLVLRVIFSASSGKYYYNHMSIFIPDTAFRHLNESTPFDLNEYNVQWKNPNYIPWNFTEYRDFEVCVYHYILPSMPQSCILRSATSVILPVSFPFSGKTTEQL